MNQLRPLKTRTADLLTGLGGNSDAVAASLRAAGVQGVPRDNRSCPIALFLTAVMGSEPRVRSIAVGHCSLQINLIVPTDLRPAGRMLVQLPKPVRQFVAAFDANRYPALVRGQSVAKTASRALG